MYVEEGTRVSCLASVNCYASLGDTMLDNIRESAAFEQIKSALEWLLRNL